ncbi:MAG: hypothetical protein ACREJG_13060 [Candidatus Rokuibacteriota bacterium]
MTVLAIVSLAILLVSTVSSPVLAQVATKAPPAPVAAAGPGERSSERSRAEEKRSAVEPSEGATPQLATKGRALLLWFLFGRPEAKHRR